MAQQSSADLARRYGGTTVTDLAQQFGGKPVTPAPVQTESTLGGVAKGAAKGLASTAIGASELVNKGLSWAGLTDRIQPEVFQAARQEFATPETGAQKLGFGAEQIAEFFVPFGIGAKAKAVNTGRKWLQTGAQMAGEAAEFGGKAALQSGGDTEDVLTAALIGGASPVVIKAAQGVRRTVGEVLPESLYQRVFKQAHDDLGLAWAGDAGKIPFNPTLAREVLDRGLRGSPRNMGVFVIKKLDTVEQALQAHLVGKTIAVPKQASYQRLLQTIGNSFDKDFSKVGAEARSLASLFRRSGPLPMADVLKARRLLDNARSTSSFRLNATLAPKQDAYKEAADQLRTLLRSDATTANLINEERILIQAKDALIDFAVKSGNRKLVDMIDRLILTGGALMPTMAPAALATVGGVKGAQSAWVLTNLGSRLNRLMALTPPAQPTVKAGAAALASGGR